MDRDGQSRLDEARQELTSYCASAVPVISECINRPAEGSRLHAAKSVAPTNATAYQVYTTAVQLMAAGMDHLSALLILFNNDELPHYACHTVARGLLEASSRSVWLLDRSITENQRASRGVLELVERFWNRYRFDALDDPNARQYLDDRIQKLIVLARAHGLDVNLAETGQRKGLPDRVGAERRPKQSGVIDQALQSEIGMGSEHLGVYSLLSGFAHSDSFTIIMDTAVVARRSGFEWRQSRPNLGLIANLSLLSAAVHRGALTLLMEAAGREPAF